MNITYTKCGDYLLPNLKLTEKEKMNNYKNTAEEIVLKEIIYGDKI